MSKEVVKKVKSTDIELKDKLVAIQRVTKVTKGGRHFSFAAIVVVGDEKGVVGYGLGKANEVTDAITKGIDDAKKNKRVIYQADVSVISDNHLSEMPVDVQLEKKQESESIHEALSKLSPEHREVLLLSRFQELSYNEIAVVMNTSEGNIKVKVHRAMKELKRIYLQIS